MALKKNYLPIILGICVAALAVVILISMITGWKLYSTEETSKPAAQQKATESAEPTSPTRGQPVTEPAPTQTEAVTEPPTDAPTEAPTEPPTEAPTATEEPLPYMDGLGAPNANEFTWLYDVAHGDYHPGLSYLSNTDLLGKWKAEIVFDGIWQLAYITIDRDATVTIQPCSINRGNGWEDQSGDPPMVFRGQFDINRVFGSGESGSVDLFTFYASGGTQYGFGSFEAMSGSTGMVGLIRP